MPTTHGSVLMLMGPGPAQGHGIAPGPGTDLGGRAPDTGARPGLPPAMSLQPRAMDHRAYIEYQTIKQSGSDAIWLLPSDFLATWLFEYITIKL